MVVEDAVAGVGAARRGGFALVVGVDRAGNRTRLDGAGADIVVADLASVDLKRLSAPALMKALDTTWRAGASAESGPWVLTYHGFDAAQEGTREALCTLANGYLGTRGAAPECRADQVHYPGTYLAGVYNRVHTSLNGRLVEDEHLVNAPNWLPLRFALAEGHWFTPGSPEVVEYRQDLDLRRGVLTRLVRLRDGAGHVTRVTSERFVSQHARHLAALRTTFEAENWSGRARVQSALDGGVVNAGVRAGASLTNQHLQTVRADEIGDDTVLLETITSQSRITLAMAARTQVLCDGQPVTVDRHSCDTGADEIGQEFFVNLAAGMPVTVEKIVAIATSRDPAISTPALAVVSWAGAVSTFADMLADHTRAWSEIWRQFGVTVQASERARTAVTLHTFHVLQAAPADPDVDAGLPARGLSGEGYRGTSSGTRSWFIRFSLCVSRPSPGRDFSIAIAGWEPHGRRRGRPVWRGRCFRGRAGATDATKPPHNSSIPAPIPGSLITPATSGMLVWPSLIASSSTPRPAGTSRSSPTRGSTWSSTWRDASRAWPFTTRRRTGTTSTR